MSILTRVIVAALMLGCWGTVFGHSGGHQGESGASGFITGFLHPFMGLDHVVAMIAVGLWGFFLGAKAVWTLPVVFPLVMAGGGALGILGVPLPAVETGIAVSALILGLAVTLAVRPPLWGASLLVGFFGIFHGYAHGLELPASTAAFPYSVGFVVATGLLHLAGITFATVGRWRWGELVVRAGGALIAGCGAWFMLV
ncbi:hypothetical protein PS874_01512 [Pseudomonas fluorescens]|nr:hypothetical protein PS874_01512 [Pseudomonas fluorescens]